MQQKYLNNLFVHVLVYVYKWQHLCSSSFMTKHKMSDRVEREREKRRMKATEKFISIKFHSAVIVDECTEKSHDCIAIAIRAFHCCIFYIHVVFIFFFWCCKICSRTLWKRHRIFLYEKRNFFQHFRSISSPFCNQFYQQCCCRCSVFVVSDLV